MLKYNGSLLKLPSTAILDYVASPIISGQYTMSSNTSLAPSGTPFYTAIAIPVANISAITESPYVTLITATGYRPSGNAAYTYNNCMKITKESNISVAFDVNVGTESNSNVVQYIGICDANDLSDWQNHSTILAQKSRSTGSGYNWIHWTDSGSCTNTKGILFFATTSDSTGSYPRLFGAIESMTINIETDERG